MLKSSYHRFAKDTLVIGIARMLVTLKGFIFLPLLTKTLGAHDYGIWAQAQVTIGLVLGVAGLGLPYALTRFLPAKTQKEEIREEFWSVFSLVSLTTFAVSLILIAAAGPIARALFEGSTEIVRITGLIILTWSLDTALLSLFRAFRQMKRYALFIVGDAYVELAAIAFLVLKGYGLLGALWAVLAVRSMIFIPLLFLINSQVRITKPHFSKITKYLSFGLPTVPGNLASWVVASSDRYVIGYFMGATSVGIYSAAYGLGSLMMMVVMVLGFVLPPTLSKLYDEGKINEVKTYLRYSLKYWLALSTPFVFGSTIVAQPVLKLFSTDEIAAQGHYVIPLVALSTLLFGTNMIITRVLFIRGKTGIIGGIWLMAGAINVMVNIVIVPYLGILGAAVSTLVAYASALGVGAFFSLREFSFSIDWFFLIKSLCAAGVMNLAIWAIHPRGGPAVLASAMAGMVIYSIVLLLLRGFTKAEMTFFWRLFRFPQS